MSAPEISHAYFYVETIINPFKIKDLNDSTKNSFNHEDRIISANLIDEIQKKAFSFIYPQHCGMHVFAIRAKDISSNKTLAYLYATAMNRIFFLEFIFVKKT